MECILKVCDQHKKDRRRRRYEYRQHRDDGLWERDERRVLSGVVYKTKKEDREQNLGNTHKNRYERKRNYFHI